MKLTPLKPTDYPELKPFFRDQRHRLCAYSLVSVLTWSTQEYQPHGTIWEDSLIIGAEFRTHRENRHLLLPISPTHEHGPEKLREIAEKLGFTSYWYASEDYIKTYGRDRIASVFTITEQEAFHDYIYRTEDLSSLKGNRYSKKRNLIHQFKKGYLRKDGRVTLEPLDPGAEADCLEFMEKWCTERGCDMETDENLSCEKQAFINTIKNVDVLEVEGILLRIDGELSAFGVTSRITDEMGALQFEKALVKVKGLYQYFDNLCAKTLLKGYRYINKESDMNVPGLTKAKKSYHPALILKSYRLDIP